jgi:hypothetical protein
MSWMSSQDVPGGCPGCPGCPRWMLEYRLNDSMNIM